MRQNVDVHTLSGWLPQIRERRPGSLLGTPLHARSPRLVARRPCSSVQIAQPNNGECAFSREECLVRNRASRPIGIVSWSKPAHADPGTGSPFAPQSRPQRRPIHRVIASIAGSRRAECGHCTLCGLLSRGIVNEIVSHKYHNSRG
jgi:hypothetical protein